MAIETAAGSSFSLRRLGVFARVGVAGLVVTPIGGAAASGAFLWMHHEERDERAGMTLDDIRAHYHGIISPAPLTESLEAGHPEDLGDRERQILLDWLGGDPATLSQGFDNLDLGADAPAEIIAVSCLDCHSRSSTGPDTLASVPLEYWDDIEALAISRDIRPVPLEILAASTHTHALGMSAIGGLIVALALVTGWSRRVVGPFVAITGLGLVLDIGGWWLTRMDPGFAVLVAVGGAAFSGGMSLLGLIVLADLCMPGRTKKQAAT